DQTQSSGEIAAAIFIAQTAPKDAPIHFLCESDTLQTTICYDLQRWEDSAWMGAENKDALRALVNILRQRCAPTTFRKVDGPDEWKMIQTGRDLAQKLESERGSDPLIPKTDKVFDLSGARLSVLTQRLAYRLIQRRTYKERPSTQRIISGILSNTRDVQEAPVTEPELWRSIRLREIRRPIADFLWKNLHGALRSCGPYWKHIPGYEDRATCTRCGSVETMHHIFTECAATGRDTIWKLVEYTWHKKQANWVRPSYDDILGMGTKAWRTKKDKRRPSAERLWRILISEAAFMIWKLRCERVINHSDDEDWEHSRQEIRARWVATINRRLHLDMSMTHKRFGRQALNKDMVTNTWKGTLHDESALPDDWTGMNRVLVG
ncbi:uncharacterized protein C8Q71DRAFT_679920, partial [Rhodofomes roseus]